MPLLRCTLALVLLAILSPLAPAQAQEATPPPQSVTIPGTIQSVLGCPADWQPACKNTYLTYDANADIWSAVFELPAGDYEYKAALNDSWNENYGQKALRNGSNIPLSLATTTKVRFLYDHKTTYVTDSVNSLFAVVAGDFQSAIGCAGNADAACLASWMQDADGDGVYTFVTTKIPAGSYSASIALAESLDNAVGDGGPGGAALPFVVTNDGDEIYFAFNSKDNTVTISTEGAPKGDLSLARAYWVRGDTLVWNIIGTPRFSYELFYAPQGGLQLKASGIEGGESLKLTFSSAGPGESLAKFPHLAGFSAFTVAEADLPKLQDALRGQLAIAARDEAGKMIDATGVQIPGVLDELFPYNGPLGVSWEGDAIASETAAPTFRVWAPTARNVALLRYETASEQEPTERIAMDYDGATGVWSARGDLTWQGQYYLYEVEVYAPSTGKIETNLVTDPYSVSLSTNSTRSQIIDLNDPQLFPEGWGELAKPQLDAFEDTVLYELHIRDFSIFDETVPAEQRGTYAAFSQKESSGMQHLAALAQAGVTHVHLLPAFDIATIEEDRSLLTPLPFEELAALPPDSPEQQALLAPLRDRDGFNWGYDPLHYNTPEGSYSTDPNGSTRVREFRQMVQALNETGLRVVMDVVYNHTNAAGQNPKAVLDRIVPGYYHRLDDKGNVTNSTCCSNTASEHAMMEKLLIDSVLLWATEYKVDGFRFDLMGHHMKRNMVALRAALDGLTLEKDGVDGTTIVLYGEGWNFGEVADSARGENAIQVNMAGTGIGTFSDRLRDAARGGGPFSGLQEQGFISGLLDDPNETDQGSADEQKLKLLDHSDLIRLGLAGNLKDYELTNREGRVVKGEFITYNGAPGGYTLDPQEQIVYVSAHDNETLFDAIQLKAPASASLAERVRMHNLGLSLVAFSQGIPFFHAGDELLRSKSLDRNSYNSSDWFNRVDWTRQTSNWGVGLPPAGDNESNWPIFGPLLANAALQPGPGEIESAYRHFLDLLAIRRSSPLFRLRTADEVKAKVRFANLGPDQVPGLIVMSLSDVDGAGGIDPQWGQIVVVFNANRAPLSYAIDDLIGLPLELHPVQQAGADAVVREARFDAAKGEFSIPGRTAAVFVSERALAQAEPTATAVSATVAPTLAAPTVVPTVAVPTAEPAPTPVATVIVATPPSPAAGSSLFWAILAAVLVVGLAIVGAIASRR
jgi:pullulanase